MTPQEAWQHQSHPTFIACSSHQRKRKRQLEEMGRKGTVPRLVLVTLLCGLACSLRGLLVNSAWDGKMPESSFPRKVFNCHVSVHCLHFLWKDVSPVTSRSLTGERVIASS